MDSFISSSVSSFINFLSEKKTILENLNSKESILISFASPVSNFSFTEKLNFLLRSGSRTFYFEHPVDNFSFFGSGDAVLISEKGEKRFELSGKKAKEYKNKIVTNRDKISSGKVPLFIGGMKFASHEDDNLWNDFNESIWFIPELLLVNDQDESFLLFNSIYSKESELQAIIQKFESRLEILSQAKEPAASEVSIKCVNGFSEKDEEIWQKLIAGSLKKISDNEIQKIVFSRKVEYNLSGDINFGELISKLRKNYPDCYLFIFHQSNSFFFGATPERLAKFSDGKIELDALAGSIGRGTNEEEDLRLAVELLNDEKNLHEHYFVVEHIINSLKDFSHDIQKEKTTIKKLANIQHILTKIKAGISSENIFMILEKLYPTPAICGIPKETALSIINTNENYNRGLYSGIIGWFNLDNEGEFVVSIRSALNINRRLFAFAGSGIVKDSNPESEWKETELKLKTIISLFPNEN